MPFPTRAERLDRINATLTNKLTNKHGRSVSSTECPLLYGVAIRAMQRKAQGFELSRLETNITNLWAAFVHDEDELAEYGKLYSQRSVTSTFPSAVTQLPIEKAYTWDDFRTDIQDTKDQVKSQSSSAFRVVDLATAKSNDEPESSTEEANNDRGITYYTSSAPPIETLGLNGRQTIYLEKFECVRKQSDSITGPKNEIYWAYSAANDVAPSHHNVTREYGSVQNGSMVRLDGGTTLYTGDIGPNSMIATHIECWEADDSNSQWVKDLKAAMWEVCDMMLEAAAEGVKSPEGKKAAAVMLILAGVSALIAGIIEWFRNDDDLVKERSIMLDYPALQSLWNSPYRADYWNFDGGSQGYHKLTLRFAY